MITGDISEEGVPIMILEVASEEWLATIDTGFNGDLELPEELQRKLNDYPVGRVAIVDVRKSNKDYDPR